MVRTWYLINIYRLPRVELCRMEERAGLEHDPKGRFQDEQQSICRSSFVYAGPSTKLPFVSQFV